MSMILCNRLPARIRANILDKIPLMFNNEVVLKRWISAAHRKP
jgi:hypothetical protein